MIKRLTRKIEVWAMPRVCVEREGNTLSIQVTFRQTGEKAAMVMDLEAAEQLAKILPQATAIVTAGVVVPEDQIGKVGE